MAKKEEAPEGAPEWLLTYGDMITLVLCFFVLLFSMSEIKKDKLSKAMRAFQQQFGVLPKYKATVQVFRQTERMTETEAFVLRRGPRGKHTSVQTIVEDQRTKIVIGGSELFEPGEYLLKPSGKQLLREDVSPDLKGFRNRIEVRGHTASARYGVEMAYEDAWELGYMRALSVMKFLSTKCGVDRRRFRVVSCADNEPRGSNLSDEGRKTNRRVEIIMTEEFIKEISHYDQK